MARLLHESFEGTGYENVWTETKGVGSVIDPDNTEVTPPADGGQQVLKIEKISPNYNALIQNDMGGQKDITYSTILCRVSAFPPSAADNIWMFSGKTAGGEWPWGIGIKRQTEEGGGAPVFQTQLYNDGSNSYIQTSEISLNQWYKIRIKYDDTNHRWEFSVDGISSYSQANSGDITGIHYVGPRYIIIGDNSNNKTCAFYADLVDVNDDTYAELPSALKRWNGSAWVKSKAQPYISGSWQSRPIRRWTGSGWTDVDGLGG